MAKRKTPGGGMNMGSMMARAQKDAVGYAGGTS